MHFIGAPTADYCTKDVRNTPGTASGSCSRRTRRALLVHPGAGLGVLRRLKRHWGSQARLAVILARSFWGVGSV